MGAGMKIPKFKTTGFGLIDVGDGRQELEAYFSKRRKCKPKECIGFVPINKPIKVLIEAEIVDTFGHDDTVSIEFEMKIKKIKVVK